VLQKQQKLLELSANNDIDYTDSTGINHDKFSFGLKKSLFNFMHGICFDYELQDWFDFKFQKLKLIPILFLMRWKKEMISTQNQMQKWFGLAENLQ
jgi:hypothetical protein